MPIENPDIEILREIEERAETDKTKKSDIFRLIAIARGALSNQESTSAAMRDFLKTIFEGIKEDSRKPK